MKRLDSRNPCEIPPQPAKRSTTVSVGSDGLEARQPATGTYLPFLVALTWTPGSRCADGRRNDRPPTIGPPCTIAAHASAEVDQLWEAGRRAGDIPSRAGLVYDLDSVGQLKAWTES